MQTDPEKEGKSNNTSEISVSTLLHGENLLFSAYVQSDFQRLDKLFVRTPKFGVNLQRLGSRDRT